MLMGGSGDTFWIRWLAVSLEHRRSSSGRALVERAINTAPLQSLLQFFFGTSSSGTTTRLCGTKDEAAMVLADLENDGGKVRTNQLPSAYRGHDLGG